MAPVHRLIPLLLFCFLGYFVEAQSSFQTHFLPGINLSKSLENNWKANLKVESRQQLSHSFHNDMPEEDYRYLFTDASILVSKKTGLNNSFAGGYLLRFGENEPAHRAIQQFTITRRYNAFRLGHRIVADETFSSNSAPVFRLRYRITPEIPLDGLALDPKEFYIKINNEYLQKLDSGVYDLEMRLAPFLGYELKDSNKMEAGVEYRIDSFLNGKPRNRLFFTVTLYQEL